MNIFLINKKNLSMTLNTHVYTSSRVLRSLIVRVHTLRLIVIETSVCE